MRLRPRIADPVRERQSPGLNEAGRSSDRGTFVPAHSWDLKATPELRAWHQDLAGLRNRIVHRGRRPTEKQASDAIAAADGMAALLTDRLLERLARYPALALAVIGAYELKRLGVYTRKVDAAFQDAGRRAAVRSSATSPGASRPTDTRNSGTERPRSSHGPSRRSSRGRACR